MPRSSVICCLFAAGCDKCGDPVKFNVPSHRPGPNYQPAEFNQAMGMMVGGNYDIEVVPAGTEFEIEEAEGLHLVKRFENYPGASGPTIQGIAG